MAAVAVPTSGNLPAFGQHRYGSRCPPPLHLSSGVYLPPPPSPLTLSYSINRTPAAIANSGGQLISPARPKFHLQGLHSPNSFTARTPRSPPAPAVVPVPGGASFVRRTSSMNTARPSSPLSSSLAGPSDLNSNGAGSLPSKTRRYSLPTATEQDHFADLCKRRFYSGGQDIEAIRAIEEILKDGSVTAQNCYNRILAAVRSEYHEEVARSKRASLERCMAANRPDAFMTKAERKERLRDFIISHGSKELIGTHPFIKGFYALLSLQAKRLHQGGAGSQCLEWIIEDEVFMEAGASEWMDDSVALLKTVIGLVEVSNTDHDNAAQPSDPPPISPFADPVSDESPFSDIHKSPTRPSQDGSSPFLRTHQRDGSQASIPLSRPNPPPPMRLSTFGSSDDRKISLNAQAGVLQEGHKRVFRMPAHFTNPELLELAALFPTWITTPHVCSVKFSSPSLDATANTAEHDSAADLEAGIADMSQGDGDIFYVTVKVGTGSLRMSREARAQGWEGTLVERVKGWFKRTFVIRSVGSRRDGLVGRKGI